MDQQISRLDTNTDDTGQQPNLGVEPRLMLLLQSFLTSFLDLGVGARSTNRRNARRPWIGLEGSPSPRPVGSALGDGP